MPLIIDPRPPFLRLLAYPRGHPLTVIRLCGSSEVDTSCDYQSKSAKALLFVTNRTWSWWRCMTQFHNYTHIWYYKLDCDLSRPDKGTKESKTLMDLMDVYGLTNLIKVPTRIVVESSSLIDVILTNKPSSLLTSGVQECLILASVITILFTLLCGYNVQN